MSGLVLVVDDDPLDCKLIDRALKATDRDLQVDTVRDGAEALAQLRSGTLPDMLLIDLNMPRMDGRELLKHVKRDQRLASIPAIIVSTSDDRSDVMACYASHANAYVTKPDSAAGYRALGRNLINFWFGSVRLAH